MRLATAAGLIVLFFSLGCSSGGGNNGGDTVVASDAASDVADARGDTLLDDGASDQVNPADLAGGDVPADLAVEDDVGLEVSGDADAGDVLSVDQVGSDLDADGDQIDTADTADDLADTVSPDVVVPTCGDGLCNGQEYCLVCEMDCGPCVSSCGNGTCDASDDCGNCPEDCGLCPGVCGDGACTGAETCSSCPDDCGICGICGNAVCEWDETCGSCPDDCGICPACPNWTCEANLAESCSNCSMDCGMCNSATCWDIMTCLNSCSPADPGCGLVCVESGSPEAVSAFYTLTDCLGGACPTGDGLCINDAILGACASQTKACKDQVKGTCGDGTCEGHLDESCLTCPADCGACELCGNGICDVITSETCYTCSQDCGSCCGNSVCDPGEDCTNCTVDCGAAAAATTSAIPASRAAPAWPTAPYATYAATATAAPPKTILAAGKTAATATTATAPRTKTTTPAQMTADTQPGHRLGLVPLSLRCLPAAEVLSRKGRDWAASLGFAGALRWRERSPALTTLLRRAPVGGYTKPRFGHGLDVATGLGFAARREGGQGGRGAALSSSGASRRSLGPGRKDGGLGGNPAPNAIYPPPRSHTCFDKGLGGLL